MPIVYAQILGTSEEHDTFPSLLVCVEELRLLFNAGEGIQRLSNEHGVKITKTKHLFLGSLCWNSWGGGPDLLFYFADAGKLGLNIYGPSPLEHFILINHYYFWKPDFFLGLHDMNDTSVVNYPSKGVFVKSFVIQKKNFVPVPSTKILNPCYEDSINMRKQIDEELKEGTDSSHDSHDANDYPDKPSAESCKLTTIKYINTPIVEKVAMVYCIHTPEIAGKFDMAAAAKLGIKKGPMCGKLVKGETVVLPDGTKVTPADCVGPSTPGPIIIVVTCPSADYVDSLTSHSGLEPYIAESKLGRIIHVFHITPDEVIISSPYQEWIKKFGPKTQHIAMHRGGKYVKPEGEKIDLHQSSYTSSLLMQMQLNKIDSDIFSLPPYSVSSPDLPPNVVRTEYLMKVHLQPPSSAGLDRSEVPKALKFSEVSISPDLETLIQNYKQQKAAILAKNDNVPEYLQNITEEEAEIVFLGTGAAIPFKLRSVTAIFVNFFSKGGLLIDTGESAYTQLCRKYGDKIDDILLNLKCIWISHKHADHHLSLPTLLLHRQEAYARANKESDPITIIAPFYISGYLTELSWFHSLKFNIIHNSLLKNKSNPMSDFFRETFGLKFFYNIRVPHIVDSYGLIFESINGWKVVFSGDTAPCEKLAKEGEGATIVIHEATMENALQDEAAGRGHSSTHDAISVGNKMGCYRTILTHFSARHHHFPVPDFVDKEKEIENVMVAFDLMTVNLKHLPYLPFIISPLVQMHKEDIARLK